MRYSQEKKRGYDNIGALIPYKEIIDDKFLNYGEYYGMVLQITPVEFFLLTEDKQDAYIRCFKKLFQFIKLRILLNSPAFTL